MAATTIDERSCGASVARSETGRGLVDLLLVVGVVAQMTLSGFALEAFGIPYNSAGGSIITKIHPATYLFSLALFIAIVANRNPIAYLIGLLSRCLGSTFLLLACMLLWVFISRYKPDYSASFLVDAIMAAGLIVLLFRDAGERTRVTVARLVHIIMVVNCLLSIFEGISGWRLFPFVLGTREQVWDHRATALLGHPLGGALATGVYAVLLMTAKNLRGLGDRWRVPIVFLCMVAMPFIGARTSFAVVYATAVAVMGLNVLHFLRGGAVSIRSLVFLMILAPVGIVVVVALFQFGLFDNFLARFVNDNGSAATRVQLFTLFSDFGLGDFLMGESYARLETTVRLNGLSEGIESTWAGLILRYGVVMAVVLSIGIAGWFVDMLRQVKQDSILPLAFVLLIISTSVGVSGKTTMLTIPTILILTFVGREPHARLSAALSAYVGDSGGREHAASGPASRLEIYDLAENS